MVLTVYCLWYISPTQCSEDWNSFCHQVQGTESVSVQLGLLKEANWVAGVRFPAGEQILLFSTVF
jgi:hypothetical protein